MRRTERDNTQSAGLHFLESTSEPVKERPKRKLKAKSRKPLVVGLCAITLGILIGIGGLLYVTRPRSPIPEAINQAVDFPLYYPARLPANYSFDKKSFRAQGNIVTYSIKNGSQIIVVTEQASPQQSFNFQDTPGFREIPSAIGEANIGAVGSAPVGIVSTDKTLVSMRGSSSGTKGAMQEIVQSLAAVNGQ